MLDVRLGDDTIFVGERLTVRSQGTLRVPDDGREYPLPPSLREFPVLRAIGYVGRVPAE